MTTCKGCSKKVSLEEFWNGPTWKTKKGKTSKLVDAGGYNRNEGRGIDVLEWVDR